MQYKDSSRQDMKKVVRRQRVTEQAPPRMPGRLQDLIIPPDSAYRLYEYQPGLFEPFLMAEHPGPDNVILFGQNWNFDLLERSKRWYIDGTFRIAPRLFSQVLVLLTEKHCKMSPLQDETICCYRNIDSSKWFL